MPKNPINKFSLYAYSDGHKAVTHRQDSNNYEATEQLSTHTQLEPLRKAHICHVLIRLMLAPEEETNEETD